MYTCLWRYTVQTYKKGLRSWATARGFAVRKSREHQKARVVGEGDTEDCEKQKIVSGTASQGRISLSC